MPKSASDLQRSLDCSFLVVGDSGMHKTGFLGTLPRPLYVFDFDNGMSRLAGESDVYYDTFKEAPKGMPVKSTGGLGLHPYGEAWPRFLDQVNVIGAEIEAGTSPYKSLAIDSLSLMTDVAMSYILKQNNRANMEQRDWGTFLQNMSSFFGQFTGWPLTKCVTAHIRRMENDLNKVEELLPLVPGQFAGKASIYFDEVYFVEIEKDPKSSGGFKRVVRTGPTNLIKQAKSRKFNVPTGTTFDFAAIRPFMEKRP